MEDGKRALVAGCVRLACQILAGCSSSEDEEIADEEALLCAVALQKYRTKAVRIENYFEVTVPRLSDKEFRENCRLSRSTFVKVAESLLVLDRFQADNGHGGYQAVVPEKQLQIALWTLGTQESFREVADRFDVSRSTWHAVLRRVVRALALDGHLAKDRRLLRRDSEQNPGAFMALWARLMGAIFPSRPLWRTRFRM